jgi:hypothetical protein
LAASAAVALLAQPGRAQALDVNDADLIHIPAKAVVETNNIKNRYFIMTP